MACISVLRMKNKALYLVTAALVVFYVFVLYLGMFPKVSEEYRMYYLSHELKDWPGYNNLNYKFGKLEYCTENRLKNGKYAFFSVCNRRGEGWKDNNRYDGTWNDDTSSVLYYRFLEEEDNAYLNIHVRDFRINSKEAEQGKSKHEVRVIYNGEVIGTFSLAGKFTFKMPKLTANELSEIVFESDDGVRFLLWTVCIEQGQYRE